MSEKDVGSAGVDAVSDAGANAGEAGAGGGVGGAGVKADVSAGAAEAAADANGTRARKAVILARGLGSRMRKASADAELTEEQAKAANSGVKAMISIGRPFLDYVISALADGGYDDICLVIGPEHDMIRDYYDEVPKSRVKISYAIQEEPLGTANAVQAAEQFADGDPVLVLNSDNYYPVEAYSALAGLPNSGLIGFDRKALVDKSNIPADRIAAFALLDAAPDGHLKEIIEKPDPVTVEAMGEDAPVSMNVFLFGPSIFEAAAKVPLSPRGEYELADAVRIAMADGEPFTVVPLAEGVLDMSNRDDIASVAKALEGTEVVL